MFYYKFIHLFKLIEISMVMSVGMFYMFPEWLTALVPPDPDHKGAIVSGQSITLTLGNN